MANSYLDHVGNVDVISDAEVRSVFILIGACNKLHWLIGRFFAHEHLVIHTLRVMKG